MDIDGVRKRFAASLTEMDRLIDFLRKNIELSIKIVQSGPGQEKMASLKQVCNPIPVAGLLLIVLKVMKPNCCSKMLIFYEKYCIIK